MLGQFQWKRVGAEWRLSHDRRQVGRVVPDSKYPDMWRVKLPGGLSDMVNLSRARDAARERAGPAGRATAECCRKREKYREKSRGIFGPVATGGDQGIGG